MKEIFSILFNYLIFALSITSFSLLLTVQNKLDNERLFYLILSLLLYLGVTSMYKMALKKENKQCTTLEKNG